MALDPKRKSACRDAIRDHIARHGAGNWDPLLREFEDVAPATFWRLVKAGKAEALAGKAKGINARADALAGDGLRAAAAALPVVPGVGDLCGAAIDPQAVLNDCLRHAQAVIEYAKGTDGRLRSPKLLLAASRAMAETLRTAAAVSAVLLDERQTRDFYRAIMDELAAEAPELRARVAARFEALTSGATLRPYVGR